MNEGIDRVTAGGVPDSGNKGSQGPVARWYAFYTTPRAEKQVYKRLQLEGYEAYLPLIKTLRQWSDRKKMVEVPLINSYIFVRTIPARLWEVNSVHGVSRYISFEGKPAAIPQTQIDNLRLIVDGNAEVEITGERIEPGDPVEVTHGSMKGLTGELVKYSNRNRVVVRIDKLDLNLLLTIQKAFLKRIV